jgi:hypothetical protein
VVLVVALSAGWGGAVDASGSTPPNPGHGGYLWSISCGAPEDCAAGGQVNGTRDEAWVISETQGRWGKAIVMPGIAKLSTGGIAQLNSVSCAAAGACAAGGFYNDAHGREQAFVAERTNGHWRNAIKVPGMATLNTGGEALVFSVSCAAPGDCAAGGFYRDKANLQAYVVDEKNGHWGRAIEVPGMATLNSGAAVVNSISCAAVGDCAAGGSYADGSGNAHAFVVSETNGTWGAAIEVPGTDLDAGGSAEVQTISCGAAGDCSAGGAYADDNQFHDSSVFLVSETNGTWGNAIVTPGLPGDGLSCAAAGECAAVGGGFVVSETNGIWGDPVPVTGAESISCAVARRCAVGGSYVAGAGTEQASVANNKANGSWSKPITVRGLPKLSPYGWRGVYAISCATAGSCAAGGDDCCTKGRQVFVVSEKNGVWGRAVLVALPRT